MNQLLDSSMDDSFRLSHPSYSALGKALSKYDVRSTISCIAGLLTIPEYQPQTLRIELLLHLACLHCRGKARPSSKDLANWLEVVLGQHPVQWAEDPPEDVFVANVIGPSGNHRILMGTWEHNDQYLQDVLACISLTRWGQSHRELQRSVTALLTLSEALLERAGLVRWTTSDASDSTEVFLKKPLRLPELATRVTFKISELVALRIDPEALAPFFLLQSASADLRHQTLGHTTLERHPLINFGNSIVFACPTATSVAIRRFVLDWLAEQEQMDEFQQLLRAKQRNTFTGLLNRLAQPVDHFVGGLPTNPPPISRDVPADAVICAIDADKAAHIVLLHDELDAVRTHGFASFGQLSQGSQKQFEDHLQAAVEQLRPRTIGGLTVIVSGGLGRGVICELPVMPDGWHVIVISLPDLISFAGSHDATFLRLYKLQEQIARALADGVMVPEINGILNVYAFWVHQDFHLIPRVFPYPSKHAVMHFGPNFVHEFRVSERRRSDHHAVPLNKQSHLAVERLHQSSYFAAGEMQAGLLVS